MILPRRNLLLPSVADGDPDISMRLADHLANVIDCAIPGVGIDHTDQTPRTPAEIHSFHTGLLLSSLMLLEPTIATPLLSQEGTEYDYSPEGGQHTDSRAHMPPNMNAREKVGRLCLKLRLHTATDPNYGAEVTMMNTGLGSMFTPGDKDCYVSGMRLSEAGLARGYDDNLPSSHDGYGVKYGEITAPGRQVVDASLMEPDVYAYTERPGNSVVFRALASMGPLTAHGFATIGTRSDPRNVRLSEVSILAQEL